MNVTTQAQWIKKLPGWVYKLGAQAWIDEEYPRHLFIETTAACNLLCEYCPRQRRGERMDFALFKQIVDEATTYGHRSFSLHLFGEPLLYPKILDAIAYLKSSHHTVHLTTNGTRLNEFADEIIKLETTQVFWTWRPEATFTPETKEKLRKWGRFRVRFIKEVTPPEAYEEWKEWENVEERSMHNYGGSINLLNWRKNADPTSKERWPCYHLWLAPAVAWNGNILICCADPHQKEVIGHFPEMSVHEAWTGQKLHEIRQSHLRGEYTGICQSCDVWKTFPDLWFKHQKK